MDVIIHVPINKVIDFDYHIKVNFKLIYGRLFFDYSICDVDGGAFYRYSDNRIFDLYLFKIDIDKLTSNNKATNFEKDTIIAKMKEFNQVISDINQYPSNCMEYIYSLYDYEFNYAQSKFVLTFEFLRGAKN